MTGLAGHVADYLELRRGLGFKLDKEAHLLTDFAGFAERAGTGTVTVDTAVAWAALPAGATPVWIAQRLGMVRQFARYLHTIDADAEIPPVGLLPARTARSAPFLYSPADIAALIAAARALPHPLRAATFATLIGLLAATGMRGGEAMRLDRHDVDWEHGALTVRDSKFGKSRLLPLHASTIDALADYRVQRERLCPTPKTASFLVSTSGARLCHATVQPTFRLLLRQAGVSRRFSGHARAFTPCDIPSRCGRCSAGIRTGRTCRPASRRCRPTSATSTPAPPTGICPRHRNCSRWPRPGWMRPSGSRRDRARPHPAGVLHRPTDRSAASQPAHHRRLPGHLPAAARLRPPRHRKARAHAGLRRPRRGQDQRVPRSPRTRTRQQRTTRNARLAAMHSLFAFAALRHPEHADLIQRVMAIPPKRVDRTTVTFLTRDEVDALLAAPDRTRWLGRRDHALLLLMIQTGLRVSELTSLANHDVRLGAGAHVHCTARAANSAAPR